VIGFRRFSQQMLFSRKMFSFRERNIDAKMVNRYEYSQEAIDWASRCPAGNNEVIEIRQVQEFADFPPDVQKAAERFPEMQTQSKQSKLP